MKTLSNNTQAHKVINSIEIIKRKMHTNTTEDLCKTIPATVTQWCHCWHSVTLPVERNYLTYTEHKTKKPNIKQRSSLAHLIQLQSNA